MRNSILNFLLKYEKIVNIAIVNRSIKKACPLGIRSCQLFFTIKFSFEIIYFTHLLRDMIPQYLTYVCV